MPAPDESPSRFAAQTGPGGPRPDAGVAVPADRGRTRRSWRWIGGLVLVPTFLFLLLVLDERAWAWLGILHVRPYFADTLAILAAGQARHAGLDPFAPNPFDPLHRPHVYGPLWLMTGSFGLTVTDTLWVGAMLDTVFVIAAAFFLAPRNLGRWTAAAVLLAAPPILLALERANNDLVVFLLLVAAAWLVSRPHRWAPFAGVALAVVAAALKLYPVAALAAFGALVRERRGRVLLAAALGFAGLLAWSGADGFRAVLGLTPRPFSIFGYGATISRATWITLAATRAWLLAGAGAASVLFGPVLVCRRRELWEGVPRDGPIGLAFVFGALTWVACYVGASNYCYRAVLLLLPAAAWIAQLDEGRHASVARWQLAGWAIVFWLMVPKRWLAVAALSEPHARAIGPLSFVIGFEQMLVFGLTVALAVAALGWGGRNLVRSRQPPAAASLPMASSD
jgi:hypothetical protein